VNEVVAAILPLISVLEHLGLTYRIGGSVASSLHGLGRSTMDIDLNVNIELPQVPMFVQNLQGLYYADAELITQALLHQQSFNLIHLESFIKVDIFPLLSGRFDQASFARVHVADNANYLTPEDTILRKLDWYRLSEGSKQQWSDIDWIFKVQKDRLDFKYLRTWAAELELSDLLEQAIEESIKDQS
jgi:hypothetical protein